MVTSWLLCQRLRRQDGHVFVHLDSSEGSAKVSTHTVMLISLKNGGQVLNTVCWKVKWMVANTK